jgi:predicted nucleic acid-binding protein
VNRLVNTTVLSNFAAVGRLDLLRDTAGPLYIPTEVYDEI